MMAVTSFMFVFLQDEGWALSPRLPGCKDSPSGKARNMPSVVIFLKRSVLAKQAQAVHTK
jgi:hypothetical protein